MEKKTHLQDLLILELQNLSCSEEHLLKAFPGLIKKVKHSSLKNLLKHHVSLSKAHKAQSEEILQLITKRKPDAGACKGVPGLIDELMSLLNNANKEAADILIITGLQKIESYKICSYNNAKVYASLQNLRKTEKLLQKISNEEREEHHLLTQLMWAVLHKEENKTQKEENMTYDTSAEDNLKEDEDHVEEDFHSNESTQEIQSPGGRAGTSHRRYRRGESRGH